MEKISGIYKIINKTNGKYYVGSSGDLSFRWNIHKLNLNKKEHWNIHLQSAWNKYGKSKFEFRFVEKIPKDQLLITEQKYLDVAKNEKDKCYNLTFHAGGGNLGSEIYKIRSEKFCGKNHHNYGKHHSEEVKKKMSIAKLGMYDGPKHPHYGKHASKETLLKMSMSMKGKLAGEKNPRYDNTVYHFINKYTGEKFSGVKMEFLKKTNRRDCYGLFSGKLKSIAGWIILT